MRLSTGYGTPQHGGKYDLLANLPTDLHCAGFDKYNQVLKHYESETTKGAGIRFKRDQKISEKV